MLNLKRLFGKPEEKPAHSAPGGTRIVPGGTRIVPQHIAIIPDGNGRWAKSRGLPRAAGHVAGGKTFRTIARYCGNIGVKFLTIYAFSTENWKRPQGEVEALMDELCDYLRDFIKNFRNENVRTRIIGDISVLRPELRALCREAEEVSQGATGLTLNIALNYGGRQEITAAARRLCEQAARGELAPKDVTEELLARGLYTAGQPDPDLIIRPSGEYRLSNFLLWQAAYAEFWYTDVLWPDFTPRELERAIADYSGRSRRYGGV